MLQAVASKKRPRLAIAVGLGWGVRNYLLGDAFRVLSENFELLILSPFARLPDFAQRFQSLGARVLGCPEAPQPNRSLRLYHLANAAFARRVPTVSRRSQKNWGGGRAWFLRGLGRCGAPLFPLLRAAYRRSLVAHWQPVAELRQLLRRERVDALFSTNCFHFSEWPAALAARAEGLPIVTAVASWDNPSTKSFLPCDYDGYLVWSTVMRDHVRAYWEVRDEERIHLTGAPQFDYYFQEKHLLSRREFCRRHGLDADRKIVVYSTVAPAIMPDEPEMLRQLHELWRRDLPGEPQLLVRLHPKDRIERYHTLREDRAARDIVWTLAGEPKLAEKDQWCPDEDDLIRGVNTVRHGDVNVHCRYSTMMLDFAALDKPVVVIAYDSEGSTARSLEYEKYEHLQPVIRSGGVRIVYTPEELERQLRLALESPERDHEARCRLAREQLGRLDGRSGERAGQAVVAIVHAQLQRRAAA